jgi:hypothetical protein
MFGFVSMCFDLIFLSKLASFILFLIIASVLDEEANGRIKFGMLKFSKCYNYVEK